MVIETGSAAWGGAATASTSNGSADDGIDGDSYAPNSDGSGGSCDSSHRATPFWERKDSGSGVVSIDKTLTTSFTTHVAPDGMGAGAYYTSDNLTVQVHAQPYAIKVDTLKPDGVDIDEKLVWKSTSGRLEDIASDCVVYEIVNYPGPDPFPWPDPFSGSTPNPVTYPKGNHAPGSQGFIQDYHQQPIWDTSKKPVEVKPFTATQVWNFKDDFTGEKDKPVPGDSGPYSITRSLKYNAGDPALGSSWTYGCVLSGCGIYCSVYGHLL